jgi:hypothetical protein
VLWQNHDAARLDLLGSHVKDSLVGLLLVLSVALTLGVRSSYAQGSNTQAAQASTERWLSLIDTQKYSASWDAAASLFRSRVTKEQWQAAVQNARGPFGQLKSRTLKSATSATTLPGAPDGEYVVFQFDASFEHKSAAVETVTATREMDGTWHVGGYFIK